MICVSYNYSVFVFDIPDMKKLSSKDKKEPATGGVCNNLSNNNDKEFTFVSEVDLKKILKIPNVDFSNLEVIIDPYGRTLFIMSSSFSILWCLRINPQVLEDNLVNKENFFEGVAIYSIPQNILNFSVLTHSYANIIKNDLSAENIDGTSEQNSHNYLLMLNDLQSNLSFYSIPENYKLGYIDLQDYCESNQNQNDKGKN